MTACTLAEIHANAPGRRDFVARFDGDITTDAEVLLLQAVEEKESILKRFAG